MERCKSWDHGAQVFGCASTVPCAELFAFGCLLWECSLDSWRLISELEASGSLETGRSTRLKACDTLDELKSRSKSRTHVLTHTRAHARTCIPLMWTPDTLWTPCDLLKEMYDLAFPLSQIARRTRVRTP